VNVITPTQSKRLKIGQRVAWHDSADDQGAPLVADLEAYMREQCAKLSRGHDLTKAMNYMFKRWPRSHASSTMATSASRTMPPKGAARHRIGQKVVVILRVRPRRTPSLRPRAHVEQHHLQQSLKKTPSTKAVIGRVGMVATFDLPSHVRRIAIAK
jgi:hypothetical protein